MIHIDFETYSAAGYHWDPAKQRWRPPEGANKAGLPTIGAEVYAMHPSTRVVCLGWGHELWGPGVRPPARLVDHVSQGGTVSAWNSQFEYWVWNHVLVPLGFPTLRLEQLRDPSARARAWGLPGSLGGCAAALGIEIQKDKRGKQLIGKISMPRNPTKNNPSMRLRQEDDPEAFKEFGEYCLKDVEVETYLDGILPELSEFEHQVWLLDQEINVRGIPVDAQAVEAACELLRQADRVLRAEIYNLTEGAVDSPSQRDRMLAWIERQGVKMPGLTAIDVKNTLASNPPPPPQVRRALEIRQALSSTSTKKIWAFKNRMTPAARIHGQFTYCGADRTGRWAGRGIQPHNFPRPDASVSVSETGLYSQEGAPAKWKEATTDQFIDHLTGCGGNYSHMAARWGDPLKALSASLRGLICAEEGCDLIGSDYAAIEAVVLAVLAGEQWRIDVFNTHGKIYETSAAKVTGRTLEEYAAYKEEHEEDHPDRALGKVAELASGYGGGVGAWLNFGADKFFTPERCEPYRNEWLRYTFQDPIAAGEIRAIDPKLAWRREVSLQDFAIKKQVWAWREASPNVVSLWRGLEQAAMRAIDNPGEVFPYRQISYVVEGGVLYCQLPSGRRLAYHQPRVGKGRYGPAIFYHANNTNPKFGGVGWVELDTYGGKLTENVVQAVARDILAHGMLNLKRAGYSIVMHVHDEVVCEEPHGRGSVEELEALMSDMPSWAKGWPVRAAGGWRGKRFRK